MKIATWNVNSIAVRLEHIFKFIGRAEPDVLAIQETKSPDEKFPVAEIEAAGYEVVYSGQKTYNGVAILSKTPVKEVVTDIPGLDDSQRRILVATIDDMRVINLYVPNGQSPDSEKYQYKLEWLKKVTAYIKSQLAEHEKVVVLGDFNIAPENQDVYNPAAWEGHVLFTDKERAALQGILELGLKDSFRLFEQESESFSWWDYRGGAFWKNHGLRIDHVLVSDALVKVCKACNIEKRARMWKRPSDHAPVMIELGG